MRRPWHRTLIAGTLVFCAVSIPYVLWIMSARHQLEQETRRLKESSRESIKSILQAAVQFVEQRLETLRAQESQRPYYHYQPLYHEPKGAHEGASIIPSPLAEHTADPLIRFHYQLNENLEVCSPLFDPGVPEVQSATSETSVEEYQTVIKPFALAAQKAFSSAPEGSTEANESAAIAQKLSRSPTNQSHASQQKLQVLDQGAYVQNTEASKLYVSLKNQGLKTGKPPVPPSSENQVVIKSTDFSYHTIIHDHEVRLTAMREVELPQGRLVQGFEIDQGELNKLLNNLKTAALPLRLVPISESRPRDEHHLSLPSIPWAVQATHDRLSAETSQKLDQLRRRNFRNFLLTGMLSISVATFITFQVWNSERTAWQRAQFAASAAHELRTPLAGLQMYAEMLAQGLGDPHKKQEYANRIASEAARLGRVVSNVLGFTRLERQTLNVQPNIGSLPEAVDEVVKGLEARMKASGVQITVRHNSAMPNLLFDRDALNQILGNLLDNAEKYSRTSRNRNIEIEMFARENHVAIQVIDHGPGIPSAMKRKVFQAFSRGNEKDSPAGLGLGLVIVQGLMHAHHGRVQVEDTPGGGATITVLFPILRQD